MDDKILLILMLITILIILYVNSNNKKTLDRKCEGKWLGGIITLIKECDQNNIFNICYHNKKNHNTFTCKAKNIDNNTIKFYFVNNTHFPYIADNCVSMTYDKINDVLVYRGKNIKDSIFDETKFKYDPNEIFVIIGRNDIQVLHNWTNDKNNSISINGHIVRNVSDFHEDGHLNYLEIDCDNYNSSGYANCKTNVLDDFVYIKNMDLKTTYHNISLYNNNCQGKWLGGSLNIKQINNNLFQFCNAAGECVYAKSENNKFILGTTSDLIENDNMEMKLCNSLYYCKVNDIFIWYGDPCLKYYSDLDNDIMSDIYMIIGRDQLIFYIGNVDAVNNSKIKLIKTAPIYNPANILIRPYN